MTSSYPAPITDLIESASLCELGPGEPNESSRAPLRKLTVESAFAGHQVVDQQMAQCCISGLWLLHNFLDESHTISQDISTASGSYWHGIMHRREPDYPNAKYWFRRTGDHPVFINLASLTGTLASEAGVDSIGLLHTEYGDWDAFAFVDYVESVAGSGDEQQRFAREVAMVEWRLLFDHCFNAAVAGAV